MNGTIIWLTGLPASGKTTIANELKEALFDAAILDGDVIRRGLCYDLNYSKEDRIENIRRTGEAALLLAKANVNVVCALVSPVREARENVRHRCREEGVHFIEVYLSTPIEACIQRDPKGHYALALAEKLPKFTGVNSPYERPLTPELTLNTNVESLESCVNKIVKLYNET
jgi:adenylyl-sulfate kinase